MQKLQSIDVLETRYLQNGAGNQINVGGGRDMHRNLKRVLQVSAGSAARVSSPKHRPGSAHAHICPQLSGRATSAPGVELVTTDI